MTKNPQVIARAPSTQSGPPKRSPLSRQQLPLTNKEMATNRSLPRLSANRPPQTDPIPPMPIAANPSSEITRGLRNRPPPLAATLAASNAGIHAQTADNAIM